MFEALLLVPQGIAGEAAAHSSWLTWSTISALSSRQTGSTWVRGTENGHPPLSHWPRPKRNTSSARLEGSCAGSKQQSRLHLRKQTYLLCNTGEILLSCCLYTPSQRTQRNKCALEPLALRNCLSILKHIKYFSRSSPTRLGE